MRTKTTISPVSMLTVYLLVFLLFLLRSQACDFGPGCLLPCHCKGQELCDADTGSCPTGCADGNTQEYYDEGAWSGEACQVGNVAFGKTATQVRDFEDYEADKAVNGITRQNYASKDCATPYTGNADTQAWWQVDLGAPHYIYNTTILIPNNCCEQNMWPGAWNVFVGNSNKYSEQSVCAHVNGSVTDFIEYSPLEKKFVIKCKEPLEGRYVTIMKAPDSEYKSRMYLCEVYVYGFQIAQCSAGRWGLVCKEACHCKENCDLVTGACSTSCTPGWLKTGDSICSEPCVDGRWGFECSQSCNCKNETEVCHKETGHCSISGCRESYSGVGCNKISRIPVAAIAASVVIFLLVLVMLAAVISLVYKRRRDKLHRIQQTREMLNRGTVDDGATIVSNDPRDQYEMATRVGPYFLPASTDLKRHPRPQSSHIYNGLNPQTINQSRAVFVSH